MFKELSFILALAGSLVSFDAHGCPSDDVQKSPDNAPKFEYKLDPNPRWFQSVHDREGEPYKKPKDPTVCELYEKNLRYFTQRDLPMACEQPISPELSDKFRAIEWENLDLDIYFNLFNSIMAEPAYRHNSGTLDERAAFWRDMLKQQKAVFRKMKKVFFEQSRSGDDKNNVIGDFSIVEFGFKNSGYFKEIADYRDESQKMCDRKTRGFSSMLFTNYYVVTSDFQKIYARPVSVDGYFNTGVIEINGQLYFEGGFEKRVRLGEFNVGRPESIEPICIYNYREITQGVK